jgi:hypothetical protein
MFVAGEPSLSGLIDVLVTRLSIALLVTTCDGHTCPFRSYLVDVSINAKVEVRPFLVYAIAKTKDGGMS